MKIGYTEFSFGYAFTENLIRSTGAGPVGAPVFPNLIQEAQAGYDVRIDLPGCPLFFQYKLPELMVKNSAKEIAQGLDGICIRFFRMPLMRRDLSEQHRLLIDLENRFPGGVYYSTPCLENVEEFNVAYNAASVHRQSAFFSPIDIGYLPDDKTHTIAYRTDQEFGWFCSDPSNTRPIPAKTFEDVEKAASQSFHRLQFHSLKRAAEELRVQVLELASPRMRAAEGLVRQRVQQRRVALRDRPAHSPQTETVVEQILVSREIARVDLGLDLLIAQPREGAQ